jgi:hypothetical protein
MVVVMNCKGGSGAQTKSNNDGVKPSEVLKDIMRAFHDQLAIGPQTAVVFLVSEPNWSLNGTLSCLIPTDPTDPTVPNGRQAHRHAYVVSARACVGAGPSERAARRQAGSAEKATTRLPKIPLLL